MTDERAQLQDITQQGGDATYVKGLTDSGGGDADELSTTIVAGPGTRRLIGDASFITSTPAVATARRSPRTPQIVVNAVPVDDTYVLTSAAPKRQGDTDNNDKEQTTVVKRRKKAPMPQLSSSLRPQAPHKPLHATTFTTEDETDFALWLNKVLWSEIEGCAEEAEKALEKTQRGVAKHILAKTTEVLKTSASLNKTCVMPPTRELFALKLYAERKFLDSLRALAYRHYQNLRPLMQSIEVAVKNGEIDLKPDRNLLAEMGSQDLILGLIRSIHPLWLRIGLETVFGEVIPLRSTSDVWGLWRFALTRVISDPEILRLNAHTSVKTQFVKPDGQKKMATHFLAKILQLLAFLDDAKIHRLISTNPCLFLRKQKKFKKTEDALVLISQEFISGKGNLIRVLKKCGCPAAYEQKPIDEYRYKVENLAKDLTDGVILARTVELINGDATLTTALLTPADTIIRKQHNMRVVFAAVSDVVKDGISPEDIVRGHREKTLLFLQRLKRDQAARVLQQAFRRRRAQPVVSEERRRYLVLRRVTIALQTRVRAAVVRREMRRLSDAALIIQKIWRGYKDRQSLKRLHCAAVRIQQHWRKSGRFWLLWKPVFELVKLNKAAICIQAHARGFLVRRQLKREKSAAKAIQCRVRTWLATTHERRRFLNMKAAATTTQSMWRGRCVRREMSKRQRAAIVIQASFRGWLVRRNATPALTKNRIALISAPSAIANSSSSTTVIDVGRSMLSRFRRCVQQIRLEESGNFSLTDISNAMQELDSVTEQSPQMCVLAASEGIPQLLFGILLRLNRSVGSQMVVPHAIKCLYNLATFERSASSVSSIDDFVDTMLYEMDRYTSHERIFVNLCLIFIAVSHHMHVQADFARSDGVSVLERRAKALNKQNTALQLQQEKHYKSVLLRVVSKLTDMKSSPLPPMFLLSKRPIHENLSASQALRLLQQRMGGPPADLQI